MAWEQKDICYSATDTIGFFVSSKKAAVDSLNYYQTRGYVCHVAYGNYTIIQPGAPEPVAVCHKNQYDAYMAEGDSCWFVGY